jgi:methylornithine synthase
VESNENAKALIGKDERRVMSMVASRSGFSLERVLAKSLEGEALTRAEIAFLLDRDDKTDLSRLFETAQAMRSRYFGDAIFLYGFVYFSTWCRNDCIFCRYRRSNPLAKRYRKDKEEVIEISSRLAESGVHLIDLTMGEDPFFLGEGEGAAELTDLIRALKAQPGLPLMVSPGVISDEGLMDFRDAGVDWYACYQETHNRRLFRRLRPGQSYDERLTRKMAAREMGMLIEEGILAGAGDVTDDIVTSIGVMKRLEAHQIRVMTFVPQEGTPLVNLAAPSFLRELLTIAVMRLVFPDRLIPASLDVGGIGGLEERLLAGANVITSLIPPHIGLVGVSQSFLDVDEGYRSVEGVIPVLEKMGLRTATAGEYAEWVDQERTQLMAEHVQAERSA